MRPEHLLVVARAHADRELFLIVGHCGFVPLSYCGRAAKFRASSRRNSARRAGAAPCAVWVCAERFWSEAGAGAATLWHCLRDGRCLGARGGRGTLRQIFNTLARGHFILTRGSTNCRYTQLTLRDTH
eukprot:scaffold28711_cov65-Phaeocystis_antarctica.AAC.4